MSARWRVDGSGAREDERMKATVIIPARLSSSRFPRKVLAGETGRPMVQHVVEACARAACVRRVVVATDSEEVVRAVEAFGGEAVLTGEHPNGTSRLAEAARVLGLGAGEVIVNVQGDEPEIPAGAIEACVGALERGGVDVGTVASPLEPGSAEFTDPNVVKVVVRGDGRALLFSRSAIPHARDGEWPAGLTPLRHVGVYSYTAGFLAKYAAMRPTPLEMAEKLEQLRVLEHGGSIGVGMWATSHAGVDTLEQYRGFVARWQAGRGGGR